MHDVTRRDFTKTAGIIAGGMMFGGGVIADDAPPPASRRSIRKAVKLGMVADGATLTDKFKLLVRLGYDGVEVSRPADTPLDELLFARDAAGLPIHGVVNATHWQKPLSHPDAAVRADGRRDIEQALRDCKALGGSTVLVVPAVVNAEVSYADAWTRSQDELRRLLPLAEDLGVRIALENVWNNFLLSPLEAARYVDAFESDRIGWYFDVGNVVLYGWPAQWVDILGRRIIKVDVKEYSRSRCDTHGRWEGFNVPLTEGDSDWPAVMSALDRQHFRSWMTAELPGGDAARLEDIARRMDRIIEM